MGITTAGSAWVSGHQIGVEVEDVHVQVRKYLTMLGLWERMAMPTARKRETTRQV